MDYRRTPVSDKRCNAGSLTRWYALSTLRNVTAVILAALTFEAVFAQEGIPSIEVVPIPSKPVYASGDTVIIG